AGGDPQVPPITTPYRRHPHHLLVSVGAEPHRAVSRSAESLGGGVEHVQGHRLAEGKTISQHPLRRLDPAHEFGVGLCPGWVERWIVPGVRGLFAKLSLEGGQDLFCLLLGDWEEARICLRV